MIQWSKVHEEAEEKNTIISFKEEEGEGVKETTEVNLTSEQWWHKNVDNIWVKIMNVVFAWPKTRGAEELKMFSSKINIVSYWKAYLKVEASALICGVPSLSCISAFRLWSPQLLQCNPSNSKSLSPSRERKDKPFGKNVICLYKMANHSQPAVCLEATAHVCMVLSFLTFSLYMA